MLLRYSLLLVLLPVLLSLSAQEAPEKVSDFNYGTTGESHIQNIYATGGNLYGTIFRFYGDDDAGLISRIDPETGAPTSVIDPDVTDWRSFGSLFNTPNIYSLNRMTFGVQRDDASGVNLYRIDGDETTLLLSKDSYNFSQLVAFEDSYYFLAGGKPSSPSPDHQINRFAELWKTDGTPEGTVLVEKIPSLYYFFSTHLVAGENSLLISIVNQQLVIDEQELYIYDPATTVLILVAEEFGEFEFPQTVSDSRLSPIAFYDGGYYAFGNREGETVNQLFRIEEETYLVTPIQLPEVPDPSGVFEIYDQLDFVSFQDGLYLFAGRADSGNGVDFYQIKGEDGTELEGLLVNEQTQGDIIAEDNYFPVIDGDTLFFLSRRPETDLALYAYSSGMAEPILRAIMDGPASSEEDYKSYWLNVDEGHFYASSQERYPNSINLESNTGFTFRVNRTSGIRDVANLTVRSPITHDGGLFFIAFPNQDAPGGLYRWSPEEAAPSPIGAFNIGFPLRPRINSSVSYEDFLSVGLDSMVLFNPATETITPIVNAGAPDIGQRIFVGKFRNELYYIGDNNRSFTDGVTISKLNTTTGEVSPVPLNTSALGIETAVYRPNSRTVLNESSFVTFFQPLDIDVPTTLAIATVTDAGFDLRPLAPPDAQPESIGSYRAFTGGGFYFNYVTTADESATAVFDDTGNLVANLSLSFSGLQTPRAINQSGVFVETVDINTRENGLLFYPFDDLENPEIFTYGESFRIASNANLHVLGENFVFPAITESIGQEWHVAVPGSGSIVPLVDIDPGMGNGITFNQATKIGRRLFFNGNDGIHGNEPWVSDGTPGNTRMLADIFPGEFSSNPEAYYLAENTIFFAANGPQGYEVYRMSPQSLNPELIINLNADDGDSHPYDFTLVGEDLYFLGREAAGSTYELYRIAFELVPTDAEPTRLAAKVFPNPVRNQSLTVGAPEGEEFERLQLFNQQGQLLREVAGNGNTSQQVSLEELPSGTYWLRSWYASGKFSINAVQRVK